MNTEKDKKIYLGIAALAVLAAIVLFAIFVGIGGNKDESSLSRWNLFGDSDVAPSGAGAAGNSGNSGARSVPRSVPEGSKLYANSRLNFSLLYPEDLQVQEFDEGNGSWTLVFGDREQTKGFQIFAVPYSKSQIDSERFFMDMPSGVHEEAQRILIDGVEAEVFFGSNSIMGETREVWFIKNGFLYEVNTFKALDAWLSQIMQTWRFEENSK